MKKHLLLLSLLFAINIVKAQNGLESIIVEKYYISDANDTIVNPDGGVLPVGSVTYRIYADLLAGYKFQAAYGVNTPGASHELRIETTTLFFNNEDRGSTSPTFSKVNAKNNTVMLDSWLSVGAACNGNFGVLKTEDDGMATNVNNDGVLLNNDPMAGIALTTEDGFIAVSGRNPEPLTAVGISAEIAMFDNQNDGTNGPVFSTFNGSWASLNGSIGPDSLVNKVLIAQITTDGVFSFELNIQIGTPTGGVENYVAKNPVGTEITIPTLIYPGTVNITEHTSTAANFTVYPNPANDFIILSINSQTSLAESNNSYVLFDMLGNTVLSKNLDIVSNKYQEQIDLSTLASGMYFLQLTTNGVATTSKIVKH